MTYKKFVDFEAELKKCRQTRNDDFVPFNKLDSSLLITIYFIWWVLLPPWFSASWLCHHQPCGVSSVHHWVVLVDMNRRCDPVCRCQQSQSSDAARPYLCKLARHGPWSVWKRFTSVGTAGRSQVAGWKGLMLDADWPQKPPSPVFFPLQSLASTSRHTVHIGSNKSTERIGHRLTVTAIVRRRFV